MYVASDRYLFFDRDCGLTTGNSYKIAYRLVLTLAKSIVTQGECPLEAVPLHGKTPRARVSRAR